LQGFVASMLRTFLRLMLCAAALAGCRASPSGSEYLSGGPGVRRAMERSLVNPDNAYGKLRLARYASGNSADWARLPAWNPPTEPIAAGELDGPGGASPTRLSGAAAALRLPEGSTPDEAALLALGARAFNLYPTQLTPYLRVALASRAAAAQYGLWVDATAGVGALVRARMADGSVALAVTCATCHTAPGADGRLHAGLPNAALDIGRAIVEAGHVPVASSIDPHARWGPGRVDVTTMEGSEPARIPDLRPVRWLTYLHQDATLRGADPVTLATRLETLIITANNQTIRPPRVVTLALAVYVRSLAAELPPLEQAAAASPRGAVLFAQTCADCHAPPGLTGEPVALAAIGTDPVLGRSRDRGTGTYRVPSLRGVGTRGPLLHDGTVPSVAALLDPARAGAAFADRLHGTGPVRGHTYGWTLSDTDRRDLVAYLQNL
jgi:mono/diheme cytochrome c family protein